MPARDDLPLDQEEARRRLVGTESTPGGVGSPLGSETLETRPLAALDALLQTNFIEDQLPRVQGLKDLQPHAESHEPMGDDYIMALGEVMFLGRYIQEYTEAGMADAAGDTVLFRLSAVSASFQFGWGKAAEVSARISDRGRGLDVAELWDPTFMQISKAHTGTPDVEPDMDENSVSFLDMIGHDIISVRRLTFYDSSNSAGNAVRLQERGDASGAILEVVRDNNSNDSYSSPVYRRLRFADPVGADDGVTKRYADALGVAAHDLLSASHSDTLAAGVTDGSIAIGNVTPKWSELVISVPAANVRNVLGVDNGEVRPSWKTALDATNPVNAGGSAAPGTSLIFSHRDHVHAVAATHSGSAHHALVTLAADAQELLNLSTQELGFVAKAMNLVLAGPVSGAAADPTFRPLVDADIPAAIARTSALHNEAHVLATTGPHTSTLPWADLNKTGSSLADLATRAHANLSDAPADAHHAKYLDAAAVSAVEAEDPLDLAGVVNLAKYLQFDEIAAPGAPAANKLRLYAADDSGVTRPYAVDSDGLVTELAGYTLIEKITLGGINQTLADFTAIPAKFRNLRIIWNGASGAGSTVFRNIILRMNADGGANYDYQYLTDGAATQTLNASGMIIGALDGVGVGNPTWGVIDIINYADTTFRRGCTFQGGLRRSLDMLYRDGLGSWNNTAAAIDRLAILSDAITAKFAVGSVAYLYGY